MAQVELQRVMRGNGGDGDDGDDERKRNHERHLQRILDFVVESGSLLFLYECSVCLEQRNYCMTPCGHHLCCGCASDIAHGNGGDSDVIRCPVCRHEFNWRHFYRNLVSANARQKEKRKSSYKLKNEGGNTWRVIPKKK